MITAFKVGLNETNFVLGAQMKGNGQKHHFHRQYENCHSFIRTRRKYVSSLAREAQINAINFFYYIRTGRPRVVQDAHGSYRTPTITRKRREQEVITRKRRDREVVI